MTESKPFGHLRLYGNVAENWRCWSKDVDLYIEATGLESTTDSKKVAILLNFTGPGAMDIYENLPFKSAVASKIFETIKEACDTYCNQRRKLVHQRFMFWEFAESEGQSLESYLNKLRIMTKA